MGGEVKGAGSKPVVAKPVVVTPPVAKPVATPPSEKAAPQERPSGFDTAMKKPVSITGRYPAGVVMSALPANGAVGAAGPADVAALLQAGAGHSNAAVKKGYSDAQNLISQGKYTEAAATLGKMMSSHEEKIGSTEQTSTYAVKSQLEFLGKMEKAGIKADYPPTEAQLVDYFKTLSKDPAGARQALTDYAANFHVHPANVPGADADVKYSPDATKDNVTTSVPNDWSEVSNRAPGANAKAESIGKQMNDCEGFAFMSEKLLGAAGFKLESHVTVHGAPVGEHAMAMFSHPKEKGTYTVTSNDGVFNGTDKKAVAKEAYIYAAGERVKMKGGEPVKDKDDNYVMEPNITGKENYATGATMQQSQINAMNRKGKDL